MTYEDWLSTTPYGYLPQRADYAKYRTEEFQQQLRDTYDQMFKPDAAGNLPYGTMGLGVLPGQDAEDMPGLDTPGFYGGRDPFTLNGQKYARVGEDLRQTFANHPKEVQDFLRRSGVPQDQWSVYDAENGYGVPYDLYAGMGSIQEKLQAGDLSDMFSYAPQILGGIGMGAALGGAFPGIDAAGSFIPAGDTSIWSQLGNYMGGDSWGVNPRMNTSPFADSDFAPGGMDSFMSDLGPIASAAGSGGGWVSSGIANAAASGASGGGSLLSSLSNFGSLSNLGAIASGVGGIAGALGSGIAGNTAANAANRATDAQLGMFNTINAQQAPYRQAGYSALSSMLGGEGLGPASGGVSSGQFTHQFGPEDLKTNLAPNYQFMLDQGLGALKNQMNRSGGFAGNTLKGINDYAMNYADNAYQHAFENYNAQNTNIFNRLSNIAGLGQTANQSTANAGTSIANSAGNSMIAGGQAQAAGQMGVANALTNAGSNAMGWYALPSLLNAFSGSANG